MNTLILQLKDFLDQHAVAEKEALLVACSGGVDSTVLVHLLLKLGYSPGLIHCNFKLRGADSDQDEQFVSELAASHQLNFHRQEFNTEAYAQFHKLSTQIAARELRYAYFQKVLTSSNSRFILLGHHADDSLETVFLNLGRGSGLMPLAGIDPARGAYLRPFWLSSRMDIMQYALDNNIQWREDLSNQEDHYQRNFIRHHLIIQLKEGFPEFEKSFATTLQRSHSDRKLFRSLIDERLEKILVKGTREERFPLDHLQKHPEEFALIYHWLKDRGKFDLAALERALEKPEAGKVFESEQGKLLLDRDYLIFKQQHSDYREEYLITEGQNLIEYPLEMRFQIKSGNIYSRENNQQVAWLDKDRLKFPLRLRRWEDGDRFVPLGMQGSKKLSDFLIDNKIDRFAKDDIWLLCSDEKICWVIGYRVDDRYKITDKTKNVYFAQVIPSDED